MRSRQTWFWFGLAVGLFAFILLFERHTGKPLRQTVTQTKLLPGFKPGDASGFQVRQGNQTIQLQRDGNSWRLTAPLLYPANPTPADQLLQVMADLEGQNHIATDKFADFGLAPPAYTVVIQTGATNLELQIGAPTPVGEAMYVRVLGTDGIFTTDAAPLSKVVLTNANDWRNNKLFPTPIVCSRIEVRGRTRTQGGALQYDLTNKLWRLSKPMFARADRGKVERLLIQCLDARVAGFVTDNPAADAERYGCQPPDLELVFGTGTNDVLTVQFGKSPTNDPAFVYARRLSHTNIVLVRRDLVEALRVSFKELRDRHLFTFPPAAVQQIDAQGEYAYSLRRQTNGAWRVVEPQEFAADAALVRELLLNLYGWEVSDEKDVVTDYSVYGLAKPLMEISLKTVATNALGTTNIVISAASFGTNSTAIGTNNAVAYFARRADEGSVYAVQEADFVSIMPIFGWQLRDRHIWNFSPTNVVRIRVRQGTQANEFIHNGTNDWSLGTASKAMMYPIAVEEAAFRLGELTAIYWLERGEAARPRLGFDGKGLFIELEVREGTGLQTYQMEFGPAREGRAPIACVTLDGQPWFFEFNRQNYLMITEALPLPTVVPATK